jgi:hypothetical protein
LAELLYGTYAESQVEKGSGKGDDYKSVSALEVAVAEFLWYYVWSSFIALGNWNFLDL